MNWNVIYFFFLLKNSLSFNVFGGITYGWCGCQSCENAPVFIAAVLAGHSRKSTGVTENSKESFALFSSTNKFGFVSQHGEYQDPETEPAIVYFLLFKIIYSGAFSPVASKGPQMKSLPLKISALLCY